MPRWNTNVSPRSVSIRPYLARRLKPITRAPVRRWPRSTGSARRRSGRRASTCAIRQPLRTRSSPRTVVSTSGSSGIAAIWRRAAKPARGTGRMTDKVNFGDELVTPEEKTRRVGAVFSSVARRYDIMNDLMSGGMHRLWKNRFVARVKPRAGEDILDMAGGTGDVPFRMARRGAHVTVADINADMLEVGKERARTRELAGLEWKVENAEALTFGNDKFDAYTIVFGIRNVTDIPAALREAHRVLKRGGRFFCMEFSSSDWPGVARLYDAWADRLIPRIGKAIADDEDSYRYLVESIRRFPRPSAFKAMVAEAGFVRANAEPMLGGLVTIHSGWKI